MRVLVLLATVALTACATDGGTEPTLETTTPTPEPTSEPTSEPTASRRPTPNASPDATSADTLTGRLGADTIEGGCTYLEAPDGTRWEVVYPDGWEVRAEPLSLTSANGEVVARGGESITVRGRAATDMASICQIGPIFEASEVVAVESR